MFPTFISILDIQSWWEVPNIAHFCSLFRTAFNLLDFDIEDLEEALLTDGTEETSWLQELIVRLLSGCLPNNEISTFNYQMFLRRLFRQKCQEHDRYNPFNTDCDFTLLPLKTKVDILHALCDFRLDAEDVLDQLKNLEADSLRVEPLGFDQNESAYWYFYGTRLYREDFEKKNNKKKEVWQVICFTEEDWFQLTKKFKNSSIKSERALYHTLSKNFLPELPRLFKEKERQARRRLLENQPRRTSDRIRKADIGNRAEGNQLSEVDSIETPNIINKEEPEAKKNCDKRAKQKNINGGSESDQESRHEMAAKKKTKSKQKKPSPSSDSSDNESNSKRRKTRAQEETPPVIPLKPVGRQTNNSLSALDGQIVIQGAAQPPSNKKKLKTSQVFQQTDEDLQVGMHKILDFVKNHDDAWPFLDPVEEEYAPNYYSIIRRPMDLTKMEEKLDNGHYKNFDKFKADFQLIVNNCRLYNGVENEYTEMVDNLVKVFEKATEKYLDQISSSDEEIAVENHEEEVKRKKKSSESPPRSTKPSATAASRKRERSVSEEPEETLETKSKKSKKTQEKESSKKEVKPLEKEDKRSQKKVEKESSKPLKENKPLKERSKARDSPQPVKETSKPEKSKKERSASPEAHKKSSKSKSKKDNKPKSKSKKTKKKAHKKKRDNSTTRRSVSSSRSPSPSPPRSVLSSPPPSSPEASLPKSATLPRCKEDSKQPSPFPWELAEEPPPSSPETHKKLDEVAPYSPLAFGIKDKHNKLRETIEKLKAKSEIGRMYTDLEIEDQLKENKDRNKKVEPKGGHHKGKKNHADAVIVIDSESQVGERKPIKNKKESPPAPVKPASNFEALSLATEQTLKDINKWLDDTPKFADFGSASNSPSYMGMDDFDLLGTPKPEPKKPVFDVLNIKPKDPTVVKEVKKKSFKDPSKFFGKRREVQRTIDRLQPGKGKGNLITNVQSATKTEEIFPLSKIKDTKNSLIVKTDTNAPKLSLGSVLDSFGKHKFAEDDRKSPHQEESVEKPAPPVTVEIPETGKITPPAAEPKDLKETEVAEKEVKEPESNSAAGGPTPNLSAWFKAFGAPKAPPPLKKPADKTDSKDEDMAAEVAPSESPQPVARQRKISTGSSVSERSSFSQDLDSPRVGMEERGAYPAPYPSPLHSGASPVTNSPRPDISPRSPYPPFNGGQMRAGFYQDTVSSSKSSPDKSCSPRENVQNSPYYQPAHVYAPNTTAQGTLYTGTSPYYTHAPNYSSTNPTPPYNMDGGSNAYYDTSKVMDQYQAKPSQNYTANSPASSQNSPATQPQMSPHSPMVLLPQTSPSVHSPSIHSPSIHSPSMHSSPGQSLHSPGMSVVSPSMGVVSPQINSPGMQPSPAAVNSPGMVNSPLNNAESESVEVPPTVTPAYPVKKRAFIETDMTQFAALQEDMTNRRLQMSAEQEAAQLQQQQQKLQEQHELHLQQQHQQQQQQQQQYLQHQQNQAMAAFVKTTMASNEALRIPSPRQQIATQKVPSKSVPYPTSTSATAQFGGSYGSREPTYPFNVPVSRPLSTDHQQKFDMSKFTNMGYSGPEVNFSKALQQQYARSELNYVRTTVQSAISQASQLLSSQSLNMNQPVASSVNSLPGYQKTSTNQQQAHVNASPYQTGRATVDSVAERLAAHVQQEASVGYKQDGRNNYNSSSLELEQAMGLSRNLSVMAGLQSASNPYYSDKSHVFNKQLFGQNSGANMGYGQQQQMQSQQAQSMYGRQMAPAELQTHDLKTATTQDRKSRKKKSSSTKGPETSSAMTAPGVVASNQTAPPQQHAFQSYVGIKSGTTPTPTGTTTGPLDSAIASLKNPPSVPGSAFNFGLTESYSNLLDDFRNPSNYFMGGAAAKPPHGQTGQSYPAFLNPAHQSRGGTYPPLGGFMDTGSHQFYQHYLSQAGVLNQGLLGAAAAAAGGYAPPAYHLAMRQPYDAMSRPSWL